MNEINNLKMSNDFIKISEIPFKERKKLVYSLCTLYKTSKLKQNISKDNSNIEQENISLFEKIFYQLDKEKRYIFKKVFLSDEKFHWTKSYYSKSTFYKKIHETINHFLFLIYAS